MKRAIHIPSLFIKKIITLFVTLFLFASIAPVFSISTDNFSFSNTAYADDTTTTDATTTDTTESKSAIDYINSADNGKIRKNITEFATLIISFFTPIIAVVVKFASILMGDAFILGRAAAKEANAYPIAELLYELWDVVRTLVNYAFLFILLFIAVMNIFPMQQDKYNIKSILPALVIGIVTVNMTWFMTRVIFDAASVATHIVYALPESIANKDAGDGKQLYSNKKCIINETPPYQWDYKEHKAKEGVTTVAGEAGKKKLYTHGSCYPAYTTIHMERGYTDIDYLDSKTGSADDLSFEDDVDMDSAEDKWLEEQGDTVITKTNYGALTIYWTDFDYSKFNEGTILPLMAFSMMQVQNLPRVADNFITTTTGEDGKFIIPDNWTSLFINTLLALILMIIILILFVVMVVNLFGRIIILWINIIVSPVMALNYVAQAAGLSGVNIENEYIGPKTFMIQAFAPAIMALPFVIGFILISVGQMYSLPGLESSGETVVKGGALVDGVASLHGFFYNLLTIAVLWAGGVKAMATTRNPITRNFADGIIGLTQRIGNAIASLPMQAPLMPVMTDDGLKLRSINNLTRDKINTLLNKIGKWDEEGRGSAHSITTDFFNRNSSLSSKVKKDTIDKLKNIKINNRDWEILAKDYKNKSELLAEFKRTKMKDFDTTFNRRITDLDTLIQLIDEAKHGGNSKTGRGANRVYDTLTAIEKNLKTPASTPTTNTTGTTTPPTPPTTNTTNTAGTNTGTTAGTT